MSTYEIPQNIDLDLLAQVKGVTVTGNVADFGDIEGEDIDRALSLCAADNGENGIQSSTGFRLVIGKGLKPNDEDIRKLRIQAPNVDNFDDWIVVPATFVPDEIDASDEFMTTSFKSILSEQYNSDHGITALI